MCYPHDTLEILVRSIFMSNFVPPIDKFVESGEASTQEAGLLEIKIKPVDNRSLFEKLLDQKAAKEEAYNEATKFSNLIRRLDNDELDFLASVNERKAQAESTKRREVETAIRKFKEAQKKLDELQPQVVLLESKPDSAAVSINASSGSFPNKHTNTKRRMPIVSGVVKKKNKKIKPDGAAKGQNPPSDNLLWYATGEQPKDTQGSESGIPQTKDGPKLISYDSSDAE